MQQPRPLARAERAGTREREEPETRMAAGG
jgi:hypothetical protein